MATNYPGSLDEYSDKVPHITEILASQINNIQDSIEAIEATVGTSDLYNFLSSSTNLDFLKLDGSSTMLGNIDVGSNYINNLLDPVNLQDAVTKNYADNLITELLAADNTFTGKNYFDEGIYLDNIGKLLLKAEDTPNGAYLNIGELTSELWSVDTKNFVWDVGIGNAGGDTPLWKLATQTMDGTSHKAVTTNWEFNHRIIIPTLFSGDTDAFGGVMTSLFFLADAATHATGLFGFAENDYSAGMFFYLIGGNSYIDGKLGGNINTILTPGAKFSFLKSDDSTSMLDIGDTGMTAAVPLNMGNQAITSVLDPSNAQDVATKNYVDNNAGGDLIDDLTPQLGGDLDTNGHEVNFADNVKLNLGTDKDFSAYYDGSYMYMKYGTNATLRASKGSLFLYGQNGHGLYLSGKIVQIQAATFHKFSSNGLTAHAGGGQADATQLIYDINEFSTVASPGDSAKLMSSYSYGQEVSVINYGANPMDLFPASNQYINGVQNAAISIPAGATAICISYERYYWGVTISRNSSIDDYFDDNVNLNFGTDKDANIHFDGTNLVIDPGTADLVINGGVQVNTTATKPAADASHRGTIWTTQGAAGAADVVEICLKSASDTYSWVNIATG